MWQFFCHIRWFPYFLLTFDDSILTLCSFNITCHSFFLTFDCSLTFFFLTFDGSILTLCGSNIIYDKSFVTLGGSLTFFSHLTVSSSYYAVLTSHVTVFSHIWWFSYFLFFFFSYLTIPSSHSVVPTSHVTILFSHLVVPLLFSHIWWFIYFFLTFDSSIVTLSSTNIASDSIFVTFCGTLFFYSQIWSFHYYIEQYQY